jgi:hypothetical protein
MSHLEASSAATSEMHVTVAALECLQALVKLVPFQFGTVLLAPPMPATSPRSDKRSSSTTDTACNVPLETTSPDVDVDTLVSSEELMANQQRTTRGHSSDDTAVACSDRFSMTCEHVAHMLAVKFLLDVDTHVDGEKRHLTPWRLKPDAQVKVLVKAIALDCCASLIAHRPELMLLNCHSTSSSELLLLSELIGYVTHTDDKMKTSAALLIGQVN